MIKALRIQNFQSHKDSTLSFSPGVNWIIGSSDSGKSAIIRSLRWAWFNEPRGFAFQSTWATEARGEKSRTGVEVVHDSLHKPETVVTRSRTASENKYTVDGTDLVAFGDDIPDAVTRATNTDSVNIQSQGDQPFLISMNPPEVARYLNSIANLTVIDEAHTRISGKMRTCDADINAAVKAEASSALLLEQFGDIDNLVARIGSAQGVESGLAADVRDLTSLTALSSRNTEITRVVSRLKELPTAQRDQIAVLVEQLKQDESSASALRSLITSQESIEEELKALSWTETAEVSQYREKSKHLTVVLVDALQKRDELALLIEKLEQVTSDISRTASIDNLPDDDLLSMCSDIERDVKEHRSLAAIVLLSTTIDKTEAETAKELALLTAEKEKLMPDACPLCGALKCNQLH